MTVFRPRRHRPDGAAMMTVTFMGDKMEEKWLEIVEFPTYEISNHGRVRRKGRILQTARPAPCQQYCHVQMWKQGKRYTKRIHTLVAAAFIGARPEGMFINHKDGQMLNNLADNLEYVTPSENIRHAIRTGLRSLYPATNLPGTKNPRAKLSEDDVRRARDLRKSGLTITEIAKTFGLAHSAMRAVLIGKSYRDVTEDRQN